MEEKIKGPLLDCGVAGLTLPGEKEPGDLHVLLESSTGTLVAVMDGLGHGEEAAIAAKLAAKVLKEHAQESVISLVRLCHERLRGTRGVVMSLASFNPVDSTVTWLGVGNVEGVLLHRDANGKTGQETLPLRGGVVGDQLPSLFAGNLPVARGDTFIFATDGVRSDFVEGLSLRDSTQKIADHILNHFARKADDALVLVVRYLGPSEVMLLG